jgi:hypothetical protein
MSKRTFALVALVTLASLVAVTVAVTAFASGSLKQATGRMVTATPHVEMRAKAGVRVNGAKPGWQGDFVYSVPTGVGGVFFHYPCPAGLVPDSGKFAVEFSDPSANSIHLIGEGIRTDVASNEWAWWINWSGAGAPAGSSITFNVHCAKD